MKIKNENESGKPSDGNVHDSKQTRRAFIAKSSLTTAGISVGLNAFSSTQTSRIFGANDKIRMGFIGIGNRGSQLLNLFLQNENCEIAALCDVYKPYTTATLVRLVLVLLNY